MRLMLLRDSEMIELRVIRSYVRDCAYCGQNFERKMLFSVAVFLLSIHFFGVLVGTQISAQVLKSYPEFYKIRSFITVYKITLLLFVS